MCSAFKINLARSHCGAKVAKVSREAAKRIPTFAEMFVFGRELSAFSFAYAERIPEEWSVNYNILPKYRSKYMSAFCK